MLKELLKIIRSTNHLHASVHEVRAIISTAQKLLLVVPLLDFLIIIILYWQLEIS